MSEIRNLNINYDKINLYFKQDFDITDVKEFDKGVFQILFTKVEEALRFIDKGDIVLDGRKIKIK